MAFRAAPSPPIASRGRPGAGAHAVVVLAMLFALVPAAQAQVPTCAGCGVGEAPDAMPGIDEVGVPALRPAVSGVVALSGSYGFSLDEPWAGSERHRASGTVAGAIHALPWLAFGVRAYGRYDAVDRGSGNDDGLTGWPTLSVRASFEPIEKLALGLDLSGWMRGGIGPAFEPTSTSFGARALGAYTLVLDADVKLTIAGSIGGILDNGRAAVPRATWERLSDADRLSLALSDFHSVTFGAGASLQIAPFEALLELTYRLLVGDRSPNAAWSPIHLVAGGRARLVDGLLELGAYLDVRLSEANADAIAVTALASPIDPLFAISLQATVRFGYQPPSEDIEHVEEVLVSAPIEQLTELPPDDLPPDDLPRGEIRGVVQGPDGRPLLRASVAITPSHITLRTDADGFFQTTIRPGRYVVTIRAEHHRAQTRRVQVVEHGVVLLNAQLQQARAH